MKRSVMANDPAISGFKTKTIYKIRIMSEKGIQLTYYNSNLIWRTVSRFMD